MTTTLDPSFLQACLLIGDFKGGQFKAAQAALLTLGLRGGDFTARDIPETITGGSRHVAGAATGALVAMGLLVVVDRIKSPDPKAKGRRLDVLRLADGKYETARTWLARNQFPAPQPIQQELFA